jgi:hypothetical protein
MKTEKLSLKSIKNVLGRAELKKIMAGSGPGGPYCCLCYNLSPPSEAYTLSQNQSECGVFCVGEGWEAGTGEPLSDCP